MIFLDYLLEATGGVLRSTPPETVTHFSGFSHDTRLLVPGELFVAVRGERGNGHDYLLDALQAGATGLLVTAHELQSLPEQLQTHLALTSTALIVVQDTRIALQDYARAILARWHPTVIAVAGSVGKTSTKEAIATVLSQNFATFRSWQNYNDLLGLPLSLGRLEAHHTYAVLEFGCDHPGEIADLCRIIHPHIGVLTTISPVQLQYFGSMTRLVTELGTLLNSLPEEGAFFYNEADATIRTLLHDQLHTADVRQCLPFTPYPHIPLLGPLDFHTQTPLRNVQWEGIQATLIEMSLDEQHAEDALQEITLRSHLLGEHHTTTMFAAYQVARQRGMSQEDIQQAMLKVSPLPGRLYPLPGIFHSRLLDDTHNAAPRSVIAGLTTLNALTPTGGKRIAVLGDMLRLGDYEEEAHRQVGQQAARSADYLVAHGERAAIMAEAARKAGLPASHITVTSSHEDAARTVRHILEQPSTSTDVVLLKGSEETRMERVTELLMAQPWEAPAQLVRQAPGWKKTVFSRADRPTWVEVDLNAIGSNTRHIQTLIGPATRILVSLKADAYGHGAVRVARTTLHNGASMLGVATVSEAIPLREAGITAPILVFGYVPLWQMREAVRLGVTVTLYSNESAQALSQAAQALEKTVNVHVKIDTGMARLGVRFEQSAEIITLLQEIQQLPDLVLEGLYTHFAMADHHNLTYAQQQLARFQQLLQMLDELDIRPPLVHAANSAAMLSLPAARFNMVRPGIAIYGLDPSEDVRLPEGFRPALSFKTQVAQVKMIPTGECISYGCTYITERPTRIAVLPVGYADGFRRAPTNWGSVLIHGQPAPLLGRVCMDQCMVDVTHLPQTRVGDEVVLIGRQGSNVLTAEEVATRLGTINYEVVSEILARVPRVSS